MINNILGFGMPGGIEWIVMLIVFTVPIWLIVWLIKSILRASKERQKTRMEVSKIADELEKIRKQGD